MSAWFSVRKWLRSGAFRASDATGPGRRAPRPTCLPALEELEPRCAPGALMGAGGQTPLSLLTNASALPAKPQASSVASVTRVVTGPSSSGSQPTAASGGTKQTAAANAAALVPSLPPTAVDSAQNSLALDPAADFADSSSSSNLATAPTAAPTGGGSAVVSGAPIAPAAPNAGASQAPASSSDAAMTTAILPNGSGKGPLPPTVTLTVPAFSNYQGAQVVVQAVGNGAPVLNQQVSIDVDLQHNGKFTDPGDANFAVGTIGSNGSAAITLPAMPAYGVYTLRASVMDSAGVIGASANATIAADPNSGTVGSEALLDLANGLPYGTPLPPSGKGQNIASSSVSQNIAPSSKVTAQDFSFMEFDSQNRVLVNVHSTLPKNLDGLETDLENQLGFTMTAVTPAQNMATGWLPVNQILNLPNLANYDSVTPVYKPELHVGSYATDGDPVIHSDTFRSTFGVDGTGVKVGVISDSANEVGGGLAASIASGDVSPTTQILADDPSGPGTDEGRAMLEIVHHIAPGASEVFNTAEGGPQAMATGIQSLVTAGARAITDDISYPDEPMFNDGVIAQAAESAVAQNVLYTTAAGNSANHGYLAAWNPMNTTVGGVTGAFQQITAGNVLQTFTLPVGQAVSLSFDYDSAFLEGGSPGNGTGNYAVPNDMQVLVTDATGAVLSTPQVFDAMGPTTNEAFADVEFTNNGSFGTNNFAFSFNLVSGAAPTMIRWVSAETGGTTVDPAALGEGAATSFGHETATGVVTTGAVDYQTPTVPEAFSSQGGNISILFDHNGVRLATPDVRAEPVVAAPDGVHTSFFDQPDGAGGFVFFGTSAATPHVAAAAALLMQQAPTATAAQVAQHLEQTALDINTPGFDDLTGNGLIQLTALTVPTSLIPVTGIVTQPGPNLTSDTATNLGPLSIGSTGSTSGSIGVLPDGQNDYAWFRWEATQAGTFTATETTTTATIGNLEMHLFTLQGNTLVELASSAAAGASAQALGESLAAYQNIFVEIKGQNGSFGVMGEGVYTLAVALT